MKSNKVDNELDEIENWIAYKDHEILDDEGIIITEEQFDQRTVKYKVKFLLTFVLSQKMRVYLSYKNCYFIF